MKKQSLSVMFATLGCGLLMGWVASIGWSEKTVDDAIYGELLKRYVKDGGVDYRGFKKEEQKLDRYLRVLEKANPDKLPRNEQFAFYINAYNAYTIKLILENYPVRSIKDIGSWWKGPWKIEFCKIGGKTFTLDEIKHSILRPRFKDPRVHFAINCASKGCPPLISLPYQGVVLDEQLDANTRAFLNDSKRNRLEGNTLYVSRIFKWFKEDFEGDVVGFFLHYADEGLKKRLLAKRNQIKVKYLDYDWSLNSQ